MDYGVITPSHPTKPTALFVLVAVAFLSLVGVAVLFLSTPWGIGLSPDSASYIYAARSLLRGEGLIDLPRWDLTRGPLTRYGPLFPTLLAGIGILGIDPVEGARFLNFSLFGANIFLTGLATFRYTQSPWPSIFSAFLILTSFVNLETHAMAISEPTFLFFAFLGLYLLARYLERGSKTFLLVIAAVALSFAFSAKYSGISALLAGVLSVLFFSQKPLRGKMRDCFIVGGLGVFPMVCWVLRNKLLMGSATGTGIALNFKPYLLPNLRELAAFSSVWLLPHGVPRLIRGVVLFIAVVFLLWGSWLVFRNQRDRFVLPLVFLMIAVCHVGVYFVTTTFLGWQPIDDRALLPVYGALVILVSSVGHRMGQMAGASKLVRSSLILLAFFFVVSYLGRGIAWGIDARKNGLGYASEEWKNSEIIKAVKGLPPGTPLYTNGIDVIYLLGGKTSTAIPAKASVLKAHVANPRNRLAPDYSSELKKMVEDLRAGDGVVVYLDGIYWRWYYPSKIELAEEAPLRIAQNFSDGTFYKVKN